MSQFTDDLTSTMNQLDLSPSQQLRYLYQQLEMDPEESDKHWIRRKICAITQLRDNPTPRQRTVGLKRGRLSASESGVENLYTCLNNIRSHLEESYVRS